MRVVRFNWLRGLSLVVLLLAGQNALHLVASAIDPLQLDYSEGLMLGGLERILRQPALGAAYSFNPLFYNTTDLAYPPVFPYLAAGLAGLLRLAEPNGTLPPLYAARLLTLGGLAVSLGFIYKLVRLLQPDRLVALAATGLFLCFHPTIYWGVYARVDALGLAFGLAGLYLVVCAEARKIGNWQTWGGAVLLFWLAFFTKQSLIAAPAAVTIYLFWSGRRRTAIGFAAGFGLLVGLGIGGLALATDGKYLFFLTMERFTPFSLSKMLKTVGLFGLLYGPLCIVAIWQAGRGFRAGGLGRLLTVWGGLAGLVALTVGKAGAADYYFFEPMAFICVMGGGWFRPGEPGLTGRIQLGGAIAQVVGLVGLGYWLIYPSNDRDIVRQADAQAASYIRQYAGADGKIFAEMSGPAVAADRPDQIFDHFIFRQLAAAGQRDGQALVADFANKRFKLALFGYDILRYDIRPDVTEPSPWPPGLEQAVRQNYRILQDIRGSDGRPYAYALVPK